MRTNGSGPGTRGIGAPPGLATVAVEPAATMIAQRPPGSAPCLRARAEALPFGDQTFDAGLAVLTIHHWSDWRAGLGELTRAVRRKVVLFTWDPDSEGFWLRNYLPEMLAADRRRFPIRQSISSLACEEFTAGLARLAADLKSGAWARACGHVLEETELDIGYCLVIANVGAG